MTVVVTGIGLRSALGNLTQSWHSLLQGRSGIRLAQPFSPFPPLPLGLIAPCPSSLADLVPWIAIEALADSQIAAKAEGWGVVVGSSRGCQGLWEQWINSPEEIGEQWLASLPQQAALLAAQQFPFLEVVKSPMAACATALWAVAQGCDLIRAGRCQQVLAGAVETPITPLTFAGFQQMGALGKTGCYPFSVEREGLVLGEGGALFVLESLEMAQVRGAKIYGQIAGWGFSCDASHGSAPAMDNQSASLAVKQALSRSRLKPKDIDFIQAHGTGTLLNDQREAALIEQFFPDTITVMATKGATGHTLGASGALGIAFSLLTLDEQQVPPMVGLKTPAFSLNFSAQDRSVERMQGLRSYENGLCFAFGFGGQNAAIALKRLV